MNNTMLELRLEINTQYERMLKMINKIGDNHVADSEFDKDNENLYNDLNNFFILLQKVVDSVERDEIKRKVYG